MADRVRRRQCHDPAQGGSLRRRRAARRRRRGIGAANTLWFEDGELVGGNTDAYGFCANLDAHAAGWDARGRLRRCSAPAARRARSCLRCSTRGVAEIRSSTARAARAEALAERFGPRVTAIGWRRACRDARARPICWSTPRRSACLASRRSTLDLGALPTDAIVTDIVYVPLETPLLAAAEARGLRPSTASACCCTRRCPASSAGSACARGDAELRACGRRRHRGR